METWKGPGTHLHALNPYQSAYSRIAVLAEAGTTGFPQRYHQRIQRVQSKATGTGSFDYFFERKNGDDSDPVFGLTLNYTQPIAAMNTSADHEKWSHLITAAVKYYILCKPGRVSVGVRYMNGSDPYAGLKQQQYLLLSINLFVGKQE